LRVSDARKFVVAVTGGGASYSISALPIWRKLGRKAK
jgi:hypothetical protein